MTDSKQRKVGAVLSYTSIIINTLVQLIYTPFLIGMLQKSEYGLYSLVNSIIGYLAVLDLGFGNAIIVYTSKYRATNDKKSEEKLHGMFKIVFYLIGLLTAILGLILFFNVNNIFNASMSDVELHKTKIMMLILIFNLCISFSFSIYSSIINAYEKFTFQKVLSIISTLLKPLIMIPFLLLGYKSIAMTLVVTFVNIIVVLSNYLYCKKKLNIKIKFNGFDKLLFKTVLGYSIWLFIGTIVDKVNWSVDHFILGAVSGTIAVSIYSVASQINTMFISFSTAISNVFLPKMSKMVAKKAPPNELTDMFIKVGRVQFYIMFLILTGFILFGKLFIQLWLGNDFIESYYVTLCLIVPALIPLIQNLGLSILQAMNKFKFKSISTFIMAIFNIIISIILAKQFGAVGAALGTSISYLICNIILINIYYYKVIKLDIIKFWKEILLMLIKYLLLIIIMVLLMNNIIMPTIYKFIIFGSIYTILYLIISYVFVFNDYEKELAKSVCKKFRRKK